MTAERPGAKLGSQVEIMPNPADMFSGNHDLTSGALKIRMELFKLATRLGVVRQDGLLVNGAGISTYVSPKGAVDTDALIKDLGPDEGQDLANRIVAFLSAPPPDSVGHWSKRSAKAWERRPATTNDRRNRRKSTNPARGNGRYSR